MKISMHQYETLRMLDIFDEEEEWKLSVNWNERGVIVMTQEDTHILLFGDEESDDDQRKPFENTQE